MLYDIELQIHNEQSAKYPIIHIRRFYQVIFLHEDLTQLDIFTAVVFRPLNVDGTPRAVGPDSFHLTIGFKVPRTAYDQIKDAPFTVNDALELFRNDVPDAWRGLWAGGCKPRVDEGMLGRAFVDFFKKVGDAKKFGFSLQTEGAEPSNDDAPLDPRLPPAQPLITTLNTLNAILLRGDRGKDDLDKLSFCLPTKLSNERIVIAPGADSQSGILQYHIQPAVQVPQGCDLISWTQVNIPLARSTRPIREILTRRRGGLSFQWRFVTADDRKPRQSEFPCDQMRVYIIPPVHKRLDETTAMLERGPPSDESDRPSRNALASMAPDDSYYFRSWMDEFNILSRQVYRVRGSYFEDTEKNTYWWFKLNAAVVPAPGLDMILFVSILIPVIAAFGVDHNRLTEIQNLASKAFQGAIGWSIDGIMIDGKFPYFYHLSPLHAWLIFLLSVAFQFFLEISWRNTGTKRPLLLSALMFASFGAALVWFLFTFIIGLDNAAYFKVSGPFIELCWLIAVVSPYFAGAVSFLFCVNAYHFSGRALSTRLRLWYAIRNTGRSIKERFKRLFLPATN